MSIISLDPYMFTKNNLNKYYFLSEDSFKNLNYKVEPSKKLINSKKINENKNFSIDQDDQLFWAFYIFNNGYEEYHLINNFFITEKNIKIENVIKIRENRHLLKANKIVKSVVENELANEKTISLITLNALALIYKLNILYIKKRIIYVMNYNEDTLINCKNIIEETTNKNIDLISMDKEIINQILDDYYIVNNVSKPVNGVSYYKIDDLINISKKLNLDISNKKKQTLYTEIVNFINN